jgi:Phospholipase_D-nuclease N-terminal
MQLLFQVSWTGFLIAWILPFVILLIPLILLLIACIHIATGKFEGNDKLVWLLIAVFIPFFGPVIYFIFGRKQRLKN